MTTPAILPAGGYGHRRDKQGITALLMLNKADAVLRL